mgnify:CR=1 FL=1
MKDLYKYGLYIDDCADTLTGDELTFHLDNLRKMYYNECKSSIKILSNQI